MKRAWTWRGFAALIFFWSLSILFPITVTAQENGAPGDNLDANGRLPRATPESQGVSSEAIAKMIDAMDQNVKTMNSLMILRHGRVIAEVWWAPFGPDVPHAMYSMSKSFTSTAAGFAVAEGLLDINKPVIDFFPDDLPDAPSENLKKMRVRDILAMAGGHDREPDYKGLVDLTRDPNDVNYQRGADVWTKKFLAFPVDHEPGTTFRYNSLGTYMVSAIVQKLTGEKVVDYLQPRLFDPLHIDPPYWESSPQGISKGGSGLFLKTEDMAKFGQLYLQKGAWNGKQLLPASWVEEATSKQVSNGDNPESDWAQGYGFQFWRCRYNSFRGDGAHCQFVVVIPDKDVVIASTADYGDYQGILNYYWQLLPEMRDEPLPENTDAHQKLLAAETGRIAQEGGSGSFTEESRILESKILGQDMKYSVYLPNGYKTSGYDYPVLYLLHGMGDNETTWLNPAQGNLKEIADAWFKDRPLDKMIIVMPDAGLTWYLNRADGRFAYEDYFFEELIPQVEKIYRIRSEKKYRSVAGLSMGGHGALVDALHHPEMFQTCYAMSAAASSEEGVQRMLERGRLKESILGEAAPDREKIKAYIKANWPQALVETFPDDQKKDLRFFLDCGDDDPLLEGNETLHRKMIQRGFSCELRVKNGGHSWDYWRSIFPETLEFISAGFRE